MTTFSTKDSLVPDYGNGPFVVAVISKIEATKTTRLVTVKCPFCQKTHTHGWPYSDGWTPPGTRVVHCANDSGSANYLIGWVVAA